MTRFAAILLCVCLAGCTSFSGGNRTRIDRKFINTDGRSDELHVRVRSSAGPWGGKLEAPEQGAEVESLDDGSLVLTLQQRFGAADTLGQKEVAIHDMDTLRDLAPIITEAVIKAIEMRLPVPTGGEK